jgi:hypothetical protein
MIALNHLIKLPTQMKGSLILLSVSISAFDKIVLPESSLLAWLLTFIALDYVTGLIKSYTNKVPITSKRMRESVSKLLQYALCIVLMILLSNWTFGEKHKELVEITVNSAYVFIGLIELKSIGENIRDINPDSPISRYLLAPILKLLRIKIKITQEKFDNHDE